MGSYPYPRNGILKIDYEFILIFKKPGKSPGVSAEIKEQSRLSHEDWNEYFRGHWNFPGERQTNHLAMFPEELPKRLIRMFSFVGDTVLDPFLGSGTTTLAAINNKRNSIGFEVNRNYKSVITEKTGIKQVDAFRDFEIEILDRDDTENDFADCLNQLPYKFRDLQSMDKRVDPKKFKFGSKIYDS